MFRLLKGPAGPSWGECRARREGWSFQGQQTENGKGNNANRHSQTKREAGNTEKIPATEEEEDNEARKNPRGKTTTGRTSKSVT